MRRSPFTPFALAAAAVATTAAAFVATRALLATPPPEGAVILVTGGSRGLGLAIASRFAERPVSLVLTARNADELQQAQATLLQRHPHLKPENFYLVPADLSQPAECQGLISAAFARFGRIDILVNNAGIIQVGPIEAMTADDFEHAMRIDFFGALHTTMAALPKLLAQTPAAGWKHRAAIVNISSIGGKFAVPHLLPYSAAKFALTGFSEGLHAEVRGKGVRVTTVCPGLMRTGGEDHAIFLGDVEKEKAWFQTCAKTPGVATTPEHAADEIFNAVAQGRAEITITPQAWVGARFAGVMPETLQWLNAVTDQYVLPKA
ncbi:MAG: SDR family NAD(P)-dependent oxidoreductase [Janthinobacterium lividum]